MNAVTRATTLTAFQTKPLRSTSARQQARAARRVLREVPRLDLRIYSDLNAVETEWRRFERAADCTAFQTFDWLATWQRHIGARQGARPVIAVGRFADGEIACILPLCIVPAHLARRLCWLGQDLCDYNAPLLARDFSQRVTPEGSSPPGTKCSCRCGANRCCASTGSSSRKCRPRSARRPIRAPILPLRPTAAARI